METQDNQAGFVLGERERQLLGHLAGIAGCQQEVKGEEDFKDLLLALEKQRYDFRDLHSEGFSYRTFLHLCSKVRGYQRLVYHSGTRVALAFFGRRSLWQRWPFVSRVSFS